MSTVHDTLAALLTVIDKIDGPENRMLALAQTRDALNAILDVHAKRRAEGSRAKPSATRVNHTALHELERAKQSAPAPQTRRFTATRRGGLIVVTWPDKQAYLAEKAVLGDGKVFGWSPVAKEWRASEAWVRKNRPEILAGLGLV
jgi:hypothetical protein